MLRLPYRNYTVTAILAAAMTMLGCGDDLPQPASPEAPRCGDGIRQPNEECDDGNAIDGDGCETSCTRPTCGNGVKDVGEECDDGNRVNGDGCDTNCTESACGNGIVAGAETCDDGNGIDGDGCDTNCTRSSCGNGVKDAGEECDDGNHVDGDGCDFNCTISVCGNHIKGINEECDGGLFCDASCQLIASEVEPNDTASTANVVSPGKQGIRFATATDEDWFAVDVTTVPTTLIARDFSFCDVSFAIFDRDGMTMLSLPATDKSCGRATAVVTVAGRYFVRATSAGVANADPFQIISIDVDTARCGNGTREQGEACDDGNTQSGDGCGETCTAERHVVEQEPNDSFVTAQGTIEQDTLIEASISGENDRDFFVLANTTDQDRTVKITVYRDANDALCGLSTSLSILREDGTFIKGISSCGSATATIPANTNVYLRGTNVLGHGPIPAYRLFVDFK